MAHSPMSGMKEPARKISVAFYRTASGEEVVRDWQKIMRRKRPPGAEGLSTLDEWLEEDGTREIFQGVAIKEVLAWQILEAMKVEGLSRKRMAERMHTSRSQIGRLLDPNDGNVTLSTLQRAAELLGRKVRVELV